MLTRLKITTRINIALFLAVIGVGLAICVAYSVLRAQMLDERKTELRNLLDMAVAVAREAMNSAGGPKTDAGRKALFASLQSSHFGDEKQANYIFAYDYNGTVTCLNNRSKIGTNRIELAETRRVTSSCESS